MATLPFRCVHFHLRGSLRDSTLQESLCESICGSLLVPTTRRRHPRPSVLALRCRRSVQGAVLCEGVNEAHNGCTEGRVTPRSLHADPRTKSAPDVGGRLHPCPKDGAAAGWQPAARSRPSCTLVLDFHKSCKRLPGLQQTRAGTEHRPLPLPGDPSPSRGQGTARATGYRFRLCGSGTVAERRPQER